MRLVRNMLIGAVAVFGVCWFLWQLANGEGPKASSAGQDSTAAVTGDSL